MRFELRYDIQAFVSPFSSPCRAKPTSAFSYGKNPLCDGIWIAEVMSFLGKTTMDYGPKLILMGCLPKIESIVTERKKSMSLLLGPMCQHIPGKKGLTDHSDVKRLMPAKEVYIPLFAGNNSQIELLVSEGDHVFIGTRLANTKSAFPVPLYSSVSGTVKGVTKRPHNSLKPQQHLVIELDEQQEAIQAFPPMDWHNASHDELVEFVKESGIIGQGGAGFPTYVKYQKVENINTLVINAVECEPYITADYKCVMDYPEQFVHGVRILQKMAEVDTVLIGVKKTHPDLINAIREEISREHAAGIEVREVPDVYPMGGERTLIRTLLKREYKRLPGECGVIVNNANTAILVARAFEMGQAQAKKYVTFSGEGLKYPTNVLVPVGMSVAEIIQQIGGFVEKQESLKLIAGGPMMGKTMVSDQIVIDRAMNAITVLKNHDEEEMTCMRCGNCTQHCPIGLQPVRIANAVKMNDAEEMEKRGAMQCIECGLCTYVCPSHIQVTENVRKAKRTLMMKARKK